MDATCCTEDRISELPDSLIQHILSFLPTTLEAVRTGILSKRWRNQWTHLPDLIFKPSGDEYFSFIENTLALHDSPTIKKFHLCYDPLSNPDPQFTSKVRFAVTKSVEDRILICSWVRGSNLLPKSLVESTSLVRLEMESCYFESHWAVNLPSLKSLKLDDCNKAIENIVSGCPLLEWLELRGCIGAESADFAIVSNSLKVLSIVNAEILDGIKITCPNLVEFNMSYSMFIDQMIENVLLGCPCIHSLKLVDCGVYDWIQVVIASNSLKELHLEYVTDTEFRVSCPNLVKLDMLCYGDTLSEAVNLPSTVCATLDYIDPYEYGYYRENKLLEQFQHVSTLTIQRSLVEIMSYLDEDRPPLPLLKSKCLTLKIGASFGLVLSVIAHALSSPMLETLVITLHSKIREEASLYNYQDKKGSGLDYWCSIKSANFACLVSHLKTIEILGLYERDDNCEIVLEFIEYLLKNARVLEKMIVSLEKSRKSFVTNVSQKILSFPRYSRCANVELLCFLR